MVLHMLHNGVLLSISYWREALEARGWGVAEQSHLPMAWLAAAAVGIVVAGAMLDNVDAAQSELTVCTGKLSYGSRHDGFAAFGAGDGGEAEGQAGQVVAGAVSWLAVFFDRAEQLAHRAVEAVGEPAAFELGRTASFLVTSSTCCCSLFGPVLRMAPWLPTTSVRSCGSNCVKPSKMSDACADSYSIIAWPKRAGGRFAWRRGPRGVDAAWFRVAHHRGEKIEPVDGEVVEDQVVHILERPAFDPAVVPMDVAVDGVDRAQQAGANRFADVTEVGRPAGVLIDGQLDAHLVGQVGQPLADVEVEDERLLAEHVFAGAEGGLDERRALGRMRRDIDDLHIVAGEHLPIVVGDIGVGIKFVAAFFARERSTSHSATTS